MGSTGIYYKVASQKGCNGTVMVTTYIYTHTYTHTYNQASIEITVRLPGQVQISGGRDVEASAKVEVAGRKVRF